MWSLIVTRSRRSIRCGEVYSPVVYPQARSIEASIAQVEPLPLVPATCTVCTSRCGSPRIASSACIRSSAKVPSL